MKLNRVGVALTTAVLCGLGVATLTPSPGTLVSNRPFCVVCSDLAALDAAANVLMFVPLGFALMLATGRRGVSVLLCVLTTVLIETVQMLAITGRDATARDVIANSLGGLLGVQLMVHRDLLLRPSRSDAARLAVAWCSVLALVLALTAAGLRPASVSRSLWSQWTPSRNKYAPFSGRVLAFDVDGIDLPLGPVSPAVGLDSVLRGRRWTATVKIATQGLVARRSIITRIANETNVLVSVEQLGRDLACLQKTKSAEFRFRSPRVALRDAFSPDVREIAHLTCTRHGGTLIVGAETRRDTVRLSPSLGWLLLSPFDVTFTPPWSWASALWLVVVTFPAGYWMSLAAIGAPTRRRGALVGAFAVAAVAGLVIAPTVAGTSVASWWEWLSALLGGVVGARIARAA